MCGQMITRVDVGAWRWLTNTFNRSQGLKLYLLAARKKINIRQNLKCFNKTRKSPNWFRVNSEMVPNDGEYL